MTTRRMAGGLACVCLALVLAPRPAGADVIVIRIADFANGTDLSNLIPGVTMQWAYGEWHSADLNYAPVVVGEGYGGQGLPYTYNAWPGVLCYEASVRGDPDSPCANRRSDGWRMMELRFDEPTTFVQITARWHSDPAAMNAFDAGFNTLARCWDNNLACVDLSTVDGFGYLTHTVSLDDATISSVVFGGLLTSVTPVEIRYSVPEPSAWALVMLGVLGLSAGRRGSHLHARTGRRRERPVPARPT